MFAPLHSNKTGSPPVKWSKFKAVCKYKAPIAVCVCVCVAQLTFYTKNVFFVQYLYQNVYFSRWFYKFAYVNAYFSYLYSLFELYYFLPAMEDENQTDGFNLGIRHVYVFLYISCSLVLCFSFYPLTMYAVLFWVWYRQLFLLIV